MDSKRQSSSWNVLRGTMIVLAFSCAMGFNAMVWAQNPVPLVNQPLVPDASAPGGPTFTLTVNGTGFVSGSVVKWNGSARATTFASTSQLKATIEAADIATAGTSSVTVVNPGPGGGTSNVVFFPISIPESTVLLSSANINVGVYPEALAVADFNGDGKLDIAVAITSGAGPGNLSILLGNGDGTFTAAPSPATGSWPVSVVVGDFNGDGIPDLAVANGWPTTGNTLTILLGDGKGGFTESSSPAAGEGPVSLAVGDFNGDGKLDLAVADWGSDFYGGTSNGTVTILLGQGDGTFVPASSSPTVGLIPVSVVTGDFNGDGKLDLAVYNWIGGDVSILLGNGDGTFTATQSPTIGPQPGLGVGDFNEMVVGDFNGDGKLDLAVANNADDTITILLGKGDGTFTPTASPPTTGVGPGGVAVGDFNGDGKLDLAVANWTYKSPTPTVNGSVTLLLGNGDGTFTPNPTSNAVEENPVAVLPGDFTGSGRLGLAVVNENSGTISVLVQPSLQPSATITPASVTFAPQAVGTKSASQKLELANPGTVPLVINEFRDPNNADFDVVEGCGPYGGSLAAGASCNIWVIFTPIKDGSRSGSVEIYDNAPDSPQIVILQGTGTGSSPIIDFEPSEPISFAPQNIGTTSAAKTLVVTNLGNAPASISGIVAGGDFAQSNNCPPTLASMASCQVPITFTPTAAGTRTGWVAFTDNAPGSPQMSLLSGTGTGPLVSLSTSSLTFPAQLSGTSSASQTVSLTNVGAGALGISSITSNGDFTATNTCGKTVSANATCVISVTFKPAAGGMRTGTLSISDNASGSPLSVALSGMGQDFSFAPPAGSSTSASLAPGSPATFTIGVSGEGGLTGMVAFTCTGAPSGATCTVSPNPVTAGSSPTNVTVAVTTAAASFSTPRSRFVPPGPPLSAGPGGWLMLALLLAAMAWAGLRLSQLRVGGGRFAGFGLAAGLMLLLALAGCGGGGVGTTANPMTPAGTSTLTVTGTMSSGTSALSHSVTLTLLVNR